MWLYNLASVALLVLISALAVRSEVLAPPAVTRNVTLPLYLGHMRHSKANVWYIVTECSDKGSP